LSKAEVTGGYARMRGIERVGRVEKEEIFTEIRYGEEKKWK